MKHHNERHAYTTASWVLAAILVGGFVVAYGAAMAGVIGVIDAWRVAFFTLLGGSISFLGMVGYFWLAAPSLSPA